MIRTWHDRRIGIGEDWKRAIDSNLESADIILLLVSADFLDSDYCYDLEMTRALERHDAGEALVVPIILRHCDWTSSPFARLQGLPKDTRPVAAWTDPDEAFADAALGLRRFIEEFTAQHRDEPDFPDVATKNLSRDLEGAYEKRAILVADGQDTRQLDEEIRHWKQLMGKDGYLKEGSFLLDGRFRLLRLLGQGGFGEVWQAYDRTRRRVVAVKVLHSQYGRDKSRRDRFFRGARLMAQLHDLPGIVQVFEEKCKDGGHHFYVMEYVTGGDFRQAVLEQRLAREERLRIVLSIGDTLRSAHERDIIHRDIKPANILLSREGQPKLTDFDLVRAPDTDGGTLTSKLGTYPYLAPEALVDASHASATADVYSLGMTLLFVLHGDELPAEVVFDLPTFLAGLDINELERQILERSVERRADYRYQSMADFCAAMRSLLDTPEPLLVSHPTPGVQNPNSGRPPKESGPITPRPWRMWIGLVALALLMVVVIGYFFAERNPDLPPNIHAPTTAEKDLAGDGATATEDGIATSRTEPMAASKACPTPTRVGSGSNHAGLLVTFGNGTSESFCVAFEKDSISGYQLLVESGLQVVTEDYGGGLGHALCFISSANRSDGCPSPVKRPGYQCYCDGTVNPHRWVFFVPDTGQTSWSLSQAGISRINVTDGGVQSQHWGTTDESPPLCFFDDICADEDGNGS